MTILSKLGRGSAKNTFTVRASLEDAAAYLFDYDSRANRAFGDVKRKVIERKGEDFELLVSRIVLLESSYTKIQQECKYFSKLKLRIIDADNIEILVSPIVERNIERRRASRSVFSFRMSFSAVMGKVEGEERSAMVLKRTGPMETKVQVSTELDFNVPIGKEIIKSELRRVLGGYKAMSSYFLNLLSGDRLHELSKKDGITLGELLYEGGRDCIKETISNCAILNSLQAKFPWFEATMEEVMRNKLRPGISQIETKAECLSIAEARKIGKSLAISLATNITAAGGVDE